MTEFKILVPYHSMPNEISITSLFFKNVLPYLSNKIDIKIIWVIIKKEKLQSEFSENSQFKIINMHDYKNAVDLLLQEKPNLVYLTRTFGLIESIFYNSSQFLSIPVLQGISFSLRSKLKRKRLALSLFKNIFKNDTNVENENKNKSSLSWKHHFFKFSFFLKTQKACNLQFNQIIVSLVQFFKKNKELEGIPIDTKFINSFFWVENENYLNRLVDLGFKKSNLFLTGNPMYDLAIKKYKNKQPQKKINKLSVLLIVNVLVEHGLITKKQREQSLIVTIRELLKYKDKISLLVKLHPSSADIPEYLKIIKKVDDAIPVYYKGSVENFLDDADIIISYSSESSAIVYGLISRKPIIIFNFFKFQNDYFINKNLVKECEKSHMLLETIEKVVSQSPSQSKLDKNLEEILYKIDGEASSRVSDLIIKLLKNNGK